jgi:hypothetical protein
MSVYPARSVAPCIHLGARQQQQSVRRRRDSRSTAADGCRMQPAAHAVLLCINLRWHSFDAVNISRGVCAAGSFRSQRRICIHSLIALHAESNTVNMHIMRAAVGIRDTPLSLRLLSRRRRVTFPPRRPPPESWHLFMRASVGVSGGTILLRLCLGKWD